MSPEDARICAHAFIDLFLVGDEVEVDLFDGQERTALIYAFRELGYKVIVSDEHWTFTVRVPDPPESP